MKKGLSLFSLLLIVSLVFTGCGGGQTPSQADSTSNKPSESQSSSLDNSDSGGQNTSSPASTPAAPPSVSQWEGPPADTISLGESIVELEPGLFAVRYDGDCGFDGFLEKGGASSDQ